MSRYTGLAGLSLAFLRAGQVSASRPDTDAAGVEHLRKARRIARRCLAAAPRSRRYVSFFVGTPGVIAIAAVRDL